VRLKLVRFQVVQPIAQIDVFFLFFHDFDEFTIWCVQIVL